MFRLAEKIWGGFDRAIDKIERLDVEIESKWRERVSRPLAERKARKRNEKSQSIISASKGSAAYVVPSKKRSLSDVVNSAFDASDRFTVNNEARLRAGKDAVTGAASKAKGWFKGRAHKFSARHPKIASGLNTVKNLPFEKPPFSQEEMARKAQVAHAYVAETNARATKSGLTQAEFDQRKILSKKKLLTQNPDTINHARSIARSIAAQTGKDRVIISKIRSRNPEITRRELSMAFGDEMEASAQVLIKKSWADHERKLNNGENPGDFDKTMKRYAGRLVDAFEEEKQLAHYGVRAKFVAQNVREATGNNFSEEKIWDKAWDMYVEQGKPKHGLPIIMNHIETQLIKASDNVRVFNIKSHKRAKDETQPAPRPASKPNRPANPVQKPAAAQLALALSAP